MPGLVIIKERGEALLPIGKKKAEAAVTAGVILAISQMQFDVLVLFTFNVGVDGFKQSTLRKRINEDSNNETAIQAQFAQ